MRFGMVTVSTQEIRSSAQCWLDVTLLAMAARRGAQMSSDYISDNTIDFACRCGDHATPPARDDDAANLARRGFLRIAVTGTVVGAIAGAIATPPPAEAALGTPDAALKAMMDGNARYVSGQLKSFNEDLSILKAKTAEKQEPFA